MKGNYMEKYVNKKPLRMWYMYKDKPCTLIEADESKNTVKIKNYADNILFTAFGVFQMNKSFSNFIYNRT